MERDRRRRLQVRRVRRVRRRLGHAADAAGPRLPARLAVRLRGRRAARLRALQLALLQRLRGPAAGAPPAGARAALAPPAQRTARPLTAALLQAHYLSAPPLLELHKGGEHAPAPVPSVPSVGFGGFC